MKSHSANAVIEHSSANEISGEDAVRAQLYQLIAALLAGPPGDDLLAAVAALDGDDSPLGEALRHCAAAAGNTAPAAEDDVYHTLFIGIGAGELVPFGSYYLTGFLHEKPLAKLRQDMADLGVEQDPEVKEPEDHIASVMELMAGLIEGRFGEGPASLSRQRTFFVAHIGNWAPQFFKDLSETRRSALYASVGQLGAVFLEIEAKSFDYA